MTTTKKLLFDLNDPDFDIQAVVESTDIDSIRSVVKQFANLDLDDDTQIEQNFKVQILLLNRMITLYEEGQTGGIETDPTTLLKQRMGCYHDVSKLWNNLEDRAKAIEQLHHAMEVYDECCNGGGGGDAIMECQVETLQLLGNTYHDDSNYAQAIEYHTRAIQTLQNASSSSPSSSTKPKIAFAYTELASVYEDQGEFAAAVIQLKRAMDVLPELPLEDGGEDYFRDGGSDMDATIRAQKVVYCQLGSIYYKMAEYSQAITTLETAVRLLNQVDGKDHPRTKEFAYLLEMSNMLAE